MTPSLRCHTCVAAAGEISSRPSEEWTIMACLAPFSLKSSANTGPTSFLPTPMTCSAGLEGLVSGPRRLKIVRTPSSLRATATFFIEGWKIWAKRNPKPHLPTASATCSPLRVTRQPRASKKSALPTAPDAERLPCFAHRTPHAASTIPAAVETLNVSRPSPPVPTMSTRVSLSGTGHGCAKDTIPSAHERSKAGSRGCCCRLERKDPV
mmetsp:Transcript_40074/g.82046  ORF Transcript_40074/g.82046 Transcript_40074/m.82046 type:complete len:209 (-) Transcript_40074:185-811(-)